MRAIVVVLGDLGRSPRMQYHALSLTEMGVAVDLVGRAGTPALAALRDSPQVEIHLLPVGNDLAESEAARRGGLARLGSLVSDAARLAALLLFRTKRADLILVQSPPSLPVLPLAWLAARLRGSRLVIDWHGFGAAMLALSLGREHWAVALTDRLEAWCARRADLSFCVSNAMRDAILAGWGAERVHVVHDRPARQFQLADSDRRGALRERFDLPPLARGLVVVTSSSWSVDEDLMMLLDAAAEVDRRLDGSPGKIVMIATGRGPGRAAFETRARALELKHVEVRAQWLDHGDYADLLAAADVGVCLHRSTTGFDPPMKILDMLGAGLPVLAFDFGPCLHELVREGHNGLLFRSASGLASDLVELALDADRRHRLRRGAAAAREPTWDGAWRQQAWPFLAEGAVLSRKL